MEVLALNVFFFFYPQFPSGILFRLPAPPFFFPLSFPPTHIHILPLRFLERQPGNKINMDNSGTEVICLTNIIFCQVVLIVMIYTARGNFFLKLKF